MFLRHSDELEIDLTDVGSREQLHALLAEAFQFPDYYGGNWDAFDECIRDVEVPSRVQITGLERLRSRLPREAQLLVECFHDFLADERGRHVTLRVS